jgi:hypothetical protein
MSLEDSMTVMFMVPKSLIKKRFKSQANRRSNFDKNQQKLLLQSLLAVGLMIRKSKSIKEIKSSFRR